MSLINKVFSNYYSLLIQTECIYDASLTVHKYVLNICFSPNDIHSKDLKKAHFCITSFPFILNPIDVFFLHRTVVCELLILLFNDVYHLELFPR